MSPVVAAFVVVVVVDAVFSHSLPFIQRVGNFLPPNFDYFLYYLYHYVYVVVFQYSGHRQLRRVLQTHRLVTKRTKTLLMISSFISSLIPLLCFCLAYDRRVICSIFAPLFFEIRKFVLNTWLVQSMEYNALSPSLTLFLWFIVYRLYYNFHDKYIPEQIISYNNSLNVSCIRCCCFCCCFHWYKSFKSNHFLIKF